MLTQTEILAAARAAQGNCTIYRLGKLLAVTNSYIYNLENGTSLASPAIAIKLAELANLEPGYVLACIEHERASRTDTSGEVARVWEQIAERMKGAAAVGVLAVLAAFGSLAPAPSYAGAPNIRSVDDLYIMRSRRKKLRAGGRS